LATDTVTPDQVLAIESAPPEECTQGSSYPDGRVCIESSDLKDPLAEDTLDTVCPVSRAAYESCDVFDNSDNWVVTSASPEYNPLTNITKFSYKVTNYGDTCDGTLYDDTISYLVYGWSGFCCVADARSTLDLTGGSISSMAKVADVCTTGLKFGKVVPCGTDASATFNISFYGDLTGVNVTSSTASTIALVNPKKNFCKFSVPGPDCGSCPGTLEFGEMQYCDKPAELCAQAEFCENGSDEVDPFTATELYDCSPSGPDLTGQDICNASYWNPSFGNYTYDPVANKTTFTYYLDIPEPFETCAAKSTAYIFVGIKKVVFSWIGYCCLSARVTATTEYYTHNGDYSGDSIITIIPSGDVAADGDTCNTGLTIPTDNHHYFCEALTTYTFEFCGNLTAAPGAMTMQPMANVDGHTCTFNLPGPKCPYCTFEGVLATDTFTPP
jgi:hypothetical protein